MQSDSSVHCTAFGLAQKGQLGGQAPVTVQGAQKGAQVFATLNAVQIQSPVPGRNVMRMACGENHNLFLTDHLKILSSGSNIYGQLGTGGQSSGSQMNQPQHAQGSQQQQVCSIQRVSEFVDNEEPTKSSKNVVGGV